MATEISALIKKRGRYKGHITRIENSIKDMKPDLVDIDELSIRKRLLTKYYNEYDKIQETIEDLIDESNHDDVTAQSAGRERERVEKRYIVCLSKIKALIKKGSQTDSANGEIGNSNIHCVQISQTSVTRDIALPVINVPKFGGDYGEWRTFVSMYTASVHNDTKLTKAQKYIYLQSFLVDKPLSLICDLDISDDNYNKAFNILKSNYDKKMSIINYHINGLLQATVAKGPNGIREFTRQIKKHIN